MDIGKTPEEVKKAARDLLRDKKNLKKFLKKYFKKETEILIRK